MKTSLAVSFVAITILGLLLSPSMASYSALDSQDITIQNNDLPYSLEHLTENQLKECENFFEDYTTLEENVFNQRYLYHKLIGNCVMLFDDPVWETEGDDRYEKLSDRLSILVTMKEAERIQEKSQTMFLEIESITELQIDGTYLVKFDGCSGHKYLSLDDIVITSDTETVMAAPPGAEGRVISPGTCGTAEIQIRADDPDSISVVIPVMAMEKVMAMGGFTLMSPRQQMAAGVEADDVECREGLVLMIRASNGSAVCVKSTTSMKLSVAGWGAVVIDDEEDIMEEDIMEEDIMEEDIMEEAMMENDTNTIVVELEEDLSMGEKDENQTETSEEILEEEPFSIGGIDLSMAAPVEGDVDAPLTIIEFGDYQCPNCKAWFQQEKSTITNNYILTGMAKLYFVDITWLGDDSVTAAQAAYCADDQDKFIDYHSTLYNNQADVEDGWASSDALKQFAVDLALDSEMFDECLDSGKYVDRVSYNTEIGTSNGVTGTPHFFIVTPEGDVKEISGPQPAVVFDATILSLGYGP